MGAHSVLCSAIHAVQTAAVLTLSRIIAHVKGSAFWYFMRYLQKNLSS